MRMLEKCFVCWQKVRCKNAKSYAVDTMPCLRQQNQEIQGNILCLPQTGWRIRITEGSGDYVQELLGHADVSTTMNIYAHATREAKRTSARLLDKVVGGD